jgi:maltoporin
MFHFNDILAVALDFGHDEVDVEGDSRGKRKMDKASIIFSASAGPNMYSRPTVRLFYTYAKWNDSAKFAGIAGQGPVCFGPNPENSNSVFGCASNGSNVGVQGEVWF